MLFYAGNASVLLRNIPLDNGQPHDVLVTVAELQVAAYMDGVLRSTGTLLQYISDCGPIRASCVLCLGQKTTPEGGAVRLNATFALARVFPRVVVNTTVAPVASAAGYLYFRRTPLAYLPAHNQLGQFPGVSLEACAAMCWANPSCKSFDAGLPGTTSQDQCNLSTDNSATALPDAIIPIASMDFYERVLY